MRLSELKTGNTYLIERIETSRNEIRSNLEEIEILSNLGKAVKVEFKCKKIGTTKVQWIYGNLSVDVVADLTGELCF